MKKLNDWVYDVHLSKGRKSPDLNPGYKYSLIDKQFYHKCFMANRNDPQASSNVTGNLRIENTYAINLMALPAIKVDLLYTYTWNWKYL